jgi:hypothetical protein
MPTIFHAIELTDGSGFITDAELRISFDYSPFERATRDCPGSAEEVNVYAASVWCCGKELGHHPAPFKSWEPVVWQHIEEERREAALSKALNAIDQ